MPTSVPTQAEHDALAARVSGTEARLADAERRLSALEVVPPPPPPPPPPPDPEPEPEPEPPREGGIVVAGTDFVTGDPIQWSGNFPDQIEVIHRPHPRIPDHWPIGHALAVGDRRGPGAPLGGGRFGVIAVPVCPVGERMSYSHYVMIDVAPDVLWQQIHSVQDINTGNGLNWKYEWATRRNTTGSTWEFGVAVAGVFEWLPQQMLRGEVYHTRLTVRRLTDTTGAWTFELFIRNPDDSESLVTSFTREGKADPVGLASVRAGGTNGWDNSGVFDYMIQGPVEVRHLGA